ncbi:MAG: TIGR02996 domain-containing protein [Labilithrix sp.]|nr:TIGR02996 domain-containing protein [Labilithrix sp.]MCW5814139.1 TIGR02996 domain-containing protein [Labilithrix sp.]
MGPPFRVRVGDSRTGPIFRFESDSFSIGRTQSNDLVLPDESVGLRHARVERTDVGAAFIVVDVRTNARTRRDEGEPFTIGCYELRLLDRDPPAAEEQTFLDALERGPTDDETRSVYADWLEEQGRPLEAEFLRAQIEIRGLAADSVRFAMLSGRVREIGRDLPPSWRRTVARPPVEKCHTRFEVTCPKAWDKMTPTANPNQRHCGTCDQIVYYARTVEEARLHAMNRRCLVVDVVPLRKRGDLDAPPPMMMAGMPAPPPRLLRGR